MYIYNIGVNITREVKDLCNKNMKSFKKETGAQGRQKAPKSSQGPSGPLRGECHYDKQVCD